MHCMAKTQITNEQIVKDYKTPIQKMNELNETRRHQKIEDTELWNQVEERVRKENKGKTEDRIQALTYAEVWKINNIKKEAPDPELTLKPDVKKTIRNNKQKVYYHTGKWEPNKWEDDEYCWSCCMSSQEVGTGCSIKIVDPDRLNIASF